MSMTTWEQQRYDEGQQRRLVASGAMQAASAALLAALIAKGAKVGEIHDHTLDEHRPSFNIREINGEYLAVDFKAEETKDIRARVLNGKVYIAVGSYGFQRRFNQRKTGFAFDEIADHIIGEAAQKKIGAQRRAMQEKLDEALDEVVTELRATNPTFLGQAIAIHREHGRITIRLSFSDPDGARAFMAIAQEAKPE